MAPIVAATAGGIRRAASLIRAGELVAFPTESCYGLGCDALNPAALERLLDAKGRSSRQQISVIVSERPMLGEIVARVSPTAERLISCHWPGPLTLVLPAVDGLPDPLVNAGGGIGVRISSDPVASALVAAVGRPVTATSANRSGARPAVYAREAGALEGLALVLDDGPRGDPPSTVVALEGDEVRVIRAGPIVVTDADEESRS